VIFDAAVGVTAGASIVIAVAGLRGARGWPRAAQIVTFGGGALLVTALLVWPFGLDAGDFPSSAMVAMLLIAAGGIASGLRSRVSPWMLLASGLLLSIAALAPKTGERATLTLVTASTWLAGFGTLPAIDAALREWRRRPARRRIGNLLWLAITAALVIHVVDNLIGRGAWLAAAPGAAWLIAAWAASSAGQLTRPGRPHAALIVVAALAIAAGALLSNP
jgi:hypothetical protein